MSIITTSFMFPLTLLALSFGLHKTDDVLTPYCVKHRP